MNGPRITALLGTALIAALVMYLLMICQLRVAAKESQKPRAEVTLLEEEYVDLLEPSMTSTEGNEDADSYLPEPEMQESQPTPASGTDVESVGDKDVPSPVVASKQPSEMKVKKDTPKQEPSAEEIKKREEEKVKREATDEVANAFKNAKGKNNTAKGTQDNGLSGQPTANNASQGTSGTGTGSVGGGWIMPKYSPVRSTVTGSVNMIVKIDNTGRVLSVTPNGGTPPAATDARVLASIEREIRAHKFSRATYDGAEGATAYITYTFK